MVQVVWLLLVVLSLSVAGDEDWVQCPLSCKCVWSSGKKSAECMNGGLQAVPSGLNSVIQILTLNGNPLHSLTSHAFQDVGLVNLHKLYLKNASLQRVDKDALAGMTVLIELDLSENSITNLHPALFRHCERIREVIVQGNPIKATEPGLFTDLKFLQRVDFSNCQLTSISPGTFARVPALTTLELRGNQLTSMDLDVVRHLPKLTNLGLTHNPWTCDCKLRPLRNWVVTNKLYVVPTSCPTGQQWTNVSENDFACKPEVVTAFQDGPFLACLVSGDPTPSVKWFFGTKSVTNQSYTGGAEYLLRASGGWFNLTVRHARGRDSGEYRCVASNAGGDAFRAVDVQFGAEDDFDGAFGGSSTTWADLWPSIVGIVAGALFLCTVVFVLCCCLRKKQSRPQSKKEMNGMAQLDAEEKTLMHSINPVQKPPRKQETALNSSETELLDSVSLPYNENGSILGSSMTDNQTTPAGTLGRSYSRDSADPPDLLAFPGKASSGRVLGGLSSPGSRPSGLAQFGTLPYARSHSPFSPPAPVVPRAGYVTIPRRPRVPSWTASLSPVLVSPDDSYCEPVYDNLGPRTTLTGSSVLSLNKMDLTPPAYKNRPLPLTPVSFDAISDQRHQSWARSTPDGGDEREMLIAASPHPQVAPSKKVPPNPPPKPKKKKSVYEDEGVDGTEV